MEIGKNQLVMDLHRQTAAKNERIAELEGMVKLWKKLSKAQDRILVAYRVGGNPGKAIDQAGDARAALANLEVK